MTEILKAEFRRTAWVLVLGLGGSLILNYYFVNILNVSAIQTFGFGAVNLFQNNAGVVKILYNFALIPIAVLLAMCQYRGKRSEEFYRSLPYSADRIYSCQAVCGLLLLCLVYIVNAVLNRLTCSRFTVAIFNEAGYINFTYMHSIYYLFFTICTYISIFAALHIVRNRALVFLWLLILLFMPFAVDVIFDCTVLLEWQAELLLGIDGNNAPFLIFGIMLIIVFEALLFAVGMSANRKFDGLDTKRIFYNKEIKFLYFLTAAPILIMIIKVIGGIA